HYDRFIIGGVSPVKKAVKLESFAELKSEYFLERREIGIINVGQEGIVKADGKEYTLLNKECLYIGKGVKEVIFQSKGTVPAKYFFCSAPAHTFFPVQKYELAKAEPLQLGSAETGNKRTIYKLVHEKGIQSCQLVMGMTTFEKGSTWNTLPCHRHDRRMEAYFYFDMNEKERVIHFMGEPKETRHLIVANDEAIISPPWSVHFGTATNSYSFIWAMAGENKDYTDMDMIDIKDIQ
ncbi:MAG: 5-dehydro-4-deoxy-D-glucuronate isomerase, partial [Cytophagaceae bacterium]|nr:5-dehydro-4-deoxy-D-glucuronate isomerase [Cytophagaceae bacterium]